MSISIDNICNFARNNKEHLIKTGGSDMNPILFVEQNGQPAAIIASPDMDKEKIIQAAMISKVSFNPDSLVFIFDATMTKQDSQEDKQDCLIIYQILRDKTMNSVVLPYSVLDENIHWEDKVLSGNSKIIEGNIPESMKSIMDMEPITKDNFLNRSDEFDILDEEQVEFLRSLPQERFSFHSSRAVLATLLDRKFKVVDCFSATNIEWTGAKQKGHKIIEVLVEKRKIKSEFKDKLIDIINQHLGEPVFVERFEFFLQKAKIKLPSSCNLSDFVQFFQQFCLQPNTSEEQVEGIIPAMYSK